MPGPGIAARWTTPSTPSYRPSMAVRAWRVCPKSVKSTRVNAARGSAKWTRSRFTTSYSWARSSSTTALPSLPLPPVTATRIATSGPSFSPAARGRSRLRGARPRPQIDSTLDGEAVDLGKLGGLERELVERREIVVELCDRARANQRRCHPRVAQRPSDRHLSQRLPSTPGDVAESAGVGQIGGGQQFTAERALPRRPRVGRDAVQGAIGHKSLRQRRECDSADSLFRQDIEQLRLDPSIDHRVGRLVDQQGRAEPPQD